MTEEPFGPIAPLVPFTDPEDAIRRANSLPYGLVVVCLHRIAQDRDVSRRTRSKPGMVNINHFGSALSETPFGGVKESGIGSEGGTETFDGYLVTKFVTLSLMPPNGVSDSAMPKWLMFTMPASIAFAAWVAVFNDSVNT